MTDQPPTAEVLLSASGVSKTFGEQRALDQVALEIRRGEVHALVGENGSGKSTLIKILAGYYLPDPGSVITVGGQQLPPGSPAESSRLGLRFVHQHLALVPEMSTADNIGLVAGYATGVAGRIRVEAQRRRAAELLDRIGVSVDLDVPVGELRPVERSSVAIARALDSTDGEIKLLVLDEPTAALPPTEVKALFRVVRDIAARGVSVLYVSHRLDEILALASVVSVLRDGRHQGTFPVAGMSRERIVEHILGEASHAAPAAAVTAQAKSRAAALSVRDLRTRYLDGLALEIARGEIVGVAGLDGSGRDEVASALGGAIRAEGTVTDAQGQRVAKLTARLARKHGIVLVLPNWHPGAGVREFDVRENVSLATLGQFSSLGAVRRARERQDVLEWLSTVDVRPRDPAKRYSLLSGGNQQKVIIARWLATRPSVLVLDDPTSGVDIGARHQIYNLLRAQAARGVGVLLCSSDLEDLVSVCDRVLCLVEGRVVAELRGADVTESSLLAAISAWRGDAPRHPAAQSPKGTA
ncbi:MAG: mglA 1 [Actinomycetia bacterium]|nr:mglA 1 [Actinomycetes bacterium]